MVTAFLRRYRRLAVLIDGDNACPDLTPFLLRHLRRFGTPTHVKVCATTHSLKGWRPHAKALGIELEEVRKATKGKNCTDHAMVIASMDLLYSQQFHGFCLVSSDGDFHLLASRLRQDRVSVYGVGRPNTPVAFQTACDVFIPTPKNFKRKG